MVFLNAIKKKIDTIPATQKNISIRVDFVHSRSYQSSSCLLFICIFSIIQKRKYRYTFSYLSALNCKMLQKQLSIYELFALPIFKHLKHIDKYYIHPAKPTTQ